MSLNQKFNDPDFTALSKAIKRCFYKRNKGNDTLSNKSNLENYRSALKTLMKLSKPILAEILFYFSSVSKLGAYQIRFFPVGSPK